MTTIHIILWNEDGSVAHKGDMNTDRIKGSGLIQFEGRHFRFIRTSGPGFMQFEYQEVNATVLTKEDFTETPI
jgi:hypothetical protein